MLSQWHDKCMHVRSIAEAQDQTRKAVTRSVKNNFVRFGQTKYYELQTLDLQGITRNYIEYTLIAFVKPLQTFLNLALSDICNRCVAGELQARPEAPTLPPATGLRLARRMDVIAPCAT